MIRAAVSRYCRATGKHARLYIHLCSPSPREWADFLHRHGGFRAIGPDCTISPNGTAFTDPYLVSIGQGVGIAEGALFIGHSGLVRQFEMIGKRVDMVGPICVGDGAFIGARAVIGMGVNVGTMAVVAAGAVVPDWTDVPAGTVFAGNPARQVSTTGDALQRAERRTSLYPWRDLIASRRAGGFDAAAEPELRRRRVSHFFGDDDPFLDSGPL